MYNDIKAITNEEVFEYLKLYKEGKVEYRDKIIVGYIPLVKYCVYRYFYTSIGKNISYSYNDLVEIGILGVIKALKYYDGRSNAKFSTFAVICIKTEILKFINPDKKKLEFLSLDEKIDEISLFPSDIDLENDYIEKEICDLLKEKITSFSPMNQDVMLSSFGFKGEKLSYSKLAKKYGCSKARIGRIVKNSLLKLQDMLTEKENGGIVK